MSLLYDIECGICGGKMDITGSTIDKDHDVTVTVHCDNCEKKIEDLESKVEELENE